MAFDFDAFQSLGTCIKLFTTKSPIFLEIYNELGVREIEFRTFCHLFGDRKKLEKAFKGLGIGEDLRNVAHSKVETIETGKH